MDDKVDPELLKRAEEVVDSHKRVRQLSISSRVNFHEKLAVITAGSLAVAVTVTGALYQKPLRDNHAMHWLLTTLAISAVLLWLSLVASILHNFLESSALHFETELKFHQGVKELFEALCESEGIKKLGDFLDSEIGKHVTDEMLEHQRLAIQRAAGLRRWEVPLSIAAVSLLAVGYLAVVVYIVALAASFD